MSKQEKIQRLDTEIKLNGHIMKLLRRSNDVAVYEQYHKESGLLVGYELFKIAIRKEEVLGGVKYPVREVYPSSEQWSSSAWTLGKDRPMSYVIDRFEKLDKEVRDGK